MEKNKTQNKRINEADYIDITAFIRAFLRLARRYLLLVCPIIVCLTACANLLSRTMVKEQYIAEASFVVGVTLSDDFSYNYTLSTTRDDHVIQMSEAFKSVIQSEYMHYLLEEETGRHIPGEIYWANAYGTNMGGIYAVSDSMENAKQIRDAVINCLPKALFTSLGGIEIKVLTTSEQVEVLHEQLKSPIIWAGGGVVGGVFAYLGIIFLITLFRNDVETPEDMLKITDLPCLGRLPKSKKKTLNKQSDYNRAFLELRKQLAVAIEQQQIKTLLFTGGYKKHGQTELLDKLYSDWIDQGKKVTRINMDLSKVPNTVAQIQKDLNQHMEKALKEADLIIINGPDYEQTAELLTIADCVDGIVYIVRAGYDQMENTNEAIRTLGFTQAKFIGYLINA